MAKLACPIHHHYNKRNIHDYFNEYHGQIQQMVKYGYNLRYANEKDGYLQIDSNKINI
jgi:hypothetical protein